MNWSKNKKSARLFLAIAGVAVLSGCSTMEKIFGNPPSDPLPGERLSVLQLQRDLVPDEAAALSEAYLPDAWENKFWPQAGGYPSHAMGHLALGSDLKRVWDVNIGRGGSRRHPLVAAPIAAEGNVYTLNTQGIVKSFDLAEGKRRWRVKAVPRGEEESGAMGGGLAYAGSYLYVTSGYKQLTALDAETGDLVWSAPTTSPARGAPTVHDNRVYVITLDNKLHVFNAQTGQPLWTHAGLTEVTNLLGTASPAADRSVVVLPLSSGELYGLRAENGQLIWEDNLSAVRRIGALSSIADIRGLPVIDKGLVYAISYSGRMVALDQVTGQRLWQREIGGAETPWAAGNLVFVITIDQQLAALTRETGATRWVTHLQRWENESKKDKPVVWTGPLYAGDRLMAFSSNGQAIEVNPVNGEILKTWKTPGAVSVTPIVADKTLLVLTDNGRLTAYRQ